ncbi:MAG: helix-hairpin-helix domain-containing protein [Planctomycetes bacterium]|nr:helix-hairpin-helix domain-containing protein [Planctomycetota bacterium]
MPPGPSSPWPARPSGAASTPRSSSGSSRRRSRPRPPRRRPAGRRVRLPAGSCSRCALTGPGRSSGPEPGPGAGFSKARRLLEDLALLILAVLVLAVPAWLRSVPGGPVEADPGSPKPLRIDIDRAAWHEWMLLEGIGEARARAIVEHRERLGGFRSVDDLEGVPGLPRGWLERARPFLEKRE